MTIAIQAAPVRGAVLVSSPAALAGRSAGAETVAFPDYRFAPNIGSHPESYELENRAVDQAGHVLAAMRALAPWAGRTIVDLGCGAGFWLPRYAAAARVIGIEPSPSLRAAATQTARAIGPHADVLAGSAEHVPLPDDSVDVVHARFAYFFPPGTDAGLAEVLRVLRPGGYLVAVDNDYRWGEFARLLTASASVPPMQTAAIVDKWWAERGASRHEVRSELRFASRADLAAVLRIELPAAVADDWLRRNPAALSVSYGFVLFAIRVGIA